MTKKRKGYEGSAKDVRDDKSQAKKRLDSFAA